jgi:hypothetical protein
MHDFLGYGMSHAGEKVAEDEKPSIQNKMKRSAERRKESWMRGTSGGWRALRGMRELET